MAPLILLYSTLRSDKSPTTSLLMLCRPCSLLLCLRACSICQAQPPCPHTAQQSGPDWGEGDSVMSLMAFTADELDSAPVQRCMQYFRAIRRPDAGHFKRPSWSCNRLPRHRVSAACCPVPGPRSHGDRRSIDAHEKATAPSSTLMLAIFRKLAKLLSGLAKPPRLQVPLELQNCWSPQTAGGQTGMCSSS